MFILPSGFSSPEKMHVYTHTDCKQYEQVTDLCKLRAALPFAISCATEFYLEVFLVRTVSL